MPQSPPSGPSDLKAQEPAVVDRALSCRSVLWARPEPGAGSSAGSGAGSGPPLEELDVRRCPVGPLLAVDCPEWAGKRCREFAPRGDEPPTVIARDEAAALLGVLAAEGTLTERYRRRLRPLTAATAVAPHLASLGSGDDGTLPAGVTARAAHVPAPLTPLVGVPADRGRRRGSPRPDLPGGEAP